MKRFLKNFIVTILFFTLSVSCSLSVAYAAQYIYYGGGLVSPEVEVEDRIIVPNIFSYCIGTWNNTATPVSITKVLGSGHSYCITGQWDDTWYGLYTPRSLQYIFWGRARKFKIELNRTQLVDKSDTFWKSVLVHELGHAFCLNDNPSTGNASIMNHNRNRNYLTWPTADDIAGVNSIYGG